MCSRCLSLGLALRSLESSSPPGQDSVCTEGLELVWPSHV